MGEKKMVKKSEFLDVKVASLPGKIHVDKWENIAKEITLAIMNIEELGIAEEKISVSLDNNFKEAEETSGIRIVIGGFFAEAINYPQKMKRILLRQMVLNVANAVDPFFPEAKINCFIKTTCEGEKHPVTLFAKTE